MTDAPERIWAKYSNIPPYKGKRGLLVDDGPHSGCSEYLRADLAKPRVKPLVWVDLHGDGSLFQTSNDHPLQYHAVINRRGRLGYLYFGFYESLEDAKAAAQADYERRILEALE